MLKQPTVLTNGILVDISITRKEKLIRGMSGYLMNCFLVALTTLHKGL